MRKTRVILLYVLIAIIMLSLTGCGNNSSKEEIKTKVEQELEYLDIKIVGILNNLNNITLQNYTITSKEIEKESDDTNNSSGGSSDKQSGEGKSSGSEGESSGGSSGSSGGSSEGGQSSSGGSGSAKSEGMKITNMEANTILTSDENNIDWDTISKDIETINEAWGVIVIDLSSLDLNNDDVLNFSNVLNDCILSIKDKDKENALKNLAKLYSFLPKYESGISAASEIQVTKQVKSYILNAYSVVDKEDWNSMQHNISQAGDTFKTLTNNIDYIKGKEYKVNKTYVLINELENSLTYKDKKLFFIKYTNLMECINAL